MHRSHPWRISRPSMLDQWFLINQKMSCLHLSRTLSLSLCRLFLREMLDKSVAGISRRITPRPRRCFKSISDDCISVATCGLDQRPRTLSANSSNRTHLQPKRWDRLCWESSLRTALSLSNRHRQRLPIDGVDPIDRIIVESHRLVDPLAKSRQ